jgi:hypothetical protein
MDNLRERFKFFLENDGYCTPPGRAACALESARLEAEWEGCDTIRFRWVYDDDLDLSWDEDGSIREGLESGRLEAFGCILEQRCKACGEWEHVDSLFGIIVASLNDPYVRCVQADMLRNL